MKKCKFFVITLLCFFCSILLINIIYGSNNASDRFQKINSGFIFYNGKYIKAPYNIEIKDLAVYINGKKVTKQITWPVINKYAFDHDPGIPPNVNKYTTLAEAAKLREPTKGIPYYAAIQWYLFTHYSYDEAFQKTIEYLRALPYVKGLYQKTNGGWVIESYAGEKHRIMFGGPVMRHVNEIWGPEGSGPPTKNELIARVNKRAKRYVNRLKKGDLFLIFSNDNEISFAERKAANLLPEILQVMNSNLEIENKVDELISLGVFPRVNRELCTYFVNNFFVSSQLMNRINTLREKIRKKYGVDALKPVEKNLDLKIIKAKDEAMLNGNNINKSDKGTAHSPDGPLIYAGCAYTYDDAFDNFSTEIQGVVDKVKDQDFNATIFEYKDTQYDSSCGTLTYENLKSLKYGDILYWASHGFKSTNGGELSFLYLKTEAQVNAWCNNDPLVEACQLVWEVNPGDTLYPWSPIAESNWATTYWEPILTQSKAIAILSCCYSYENGWAAACGGGVSFGYNISTTGSACEYNNEQLLGRMNGTIDGGQYRKAYEAYNHMPEHKSQFKIVPTTAEITLCPSPKNYYPQDGSVVGETGTGYFEVDTYCHDDVPADETLTFATAGVVAINNVHWVDADADKVKKIEFDWDGTGFFEVAVNVHHEKFHSWGATSGGYHLLDVDRIAPNTHDAIYHFTSGVIDAALVLDRSGSMGGDKITQAKNASNQFVAMMNRGDNLAVCSFSSSASPNFTITTITGDSIKYLAQSAINAITTGGNTSIGSGIYCGQGQLSANPNPNYPQAMILLSDGQENTSPMVADVLPSIPEETDIYTIGLGSDADGYLLNYIASQTGGFYSFSPSVYRLCEIFVTIMHKVSRRQQIALRGGTISSGKEEIIHDVLVDGSVQEAKFSLLWQDSANDLDLELITPDSILIDSAFANSDPNISFSSFPAIEFFTITYPDSGLWKIKVIGVDITGTEEYVVSVSGNTDIEIDIAFDNDNYIGNDTVNVTAELTESGIPILGTDVFALIETPSTREKESAREMYEYKKNDFIPENLLISENPEYAERGIDTLIFFDDGNHGDGDADDGIYGNYYHNTSLIGSYAFNVYAAGSTTTAGSFNREAYRSIYIQEPPEIYFPDPDIDFGDVIVTTSKSLDLEIKNIGSDAAADLVIENIQTTNPAFQVDTTTFVIPPQEYDTLVITFSPTVVDSFEYYLTMETNDPTALNVQLPLKGNCIPAPVINVSPDSVYTELFTGDTTSQTVTIENSGGSDLIWQVIGFGTNNNIVINEIFTGSPDWVELYNGTQETINLQNWTFAWTSNDGLSNSYTLPEFYMTPGAYAVLLDNSGTNDSIYIHTSRNINWSSSRGGSCSIIDNSGNGVDFMRFGGSDENPPMGTYWFETVPLDMPNYSHSLGRDYAGTDTDHSTDWTIQDITEAGHNEFGSKTNGPKTSWLSINQGSGSISPDSTMDLEFSFNAFGLDGGIYEADIMILSNDPDTSELNIDATLCVTGASDIFLSDDSLTFDTTYVAYSDSNTLIITNLGSENLNIANIVPDLIVFDVDITNFDVSVGGSKEVIVSFTPDDNMVYDGILTIYSNDPDQPTSEVDLYGIGIHPGDINIPVDSLTQNLNQGSTDTQILTIENNGLGTLDFELTLQNVWQSKFKDNAKADSVKAFVLDSWGSDYASGTWNYINSNFSNILIDYSTLNKYNITYSDIQSSGADVLIISDAWKSTYALTTSELDAIIQYINAGHGLIITAGTFNTYLVPDHNILAPILGLDSTAFYEWSDGANYVGGIFTEYDSVNTWHPIFNNISEPYVPDHLSSSVPNTRNWFDAIDEAQILAKTSNNEAVITVYRDRVYISNIPEDDANTDDYNLLYNSIMYAANTGVSWLSADIYSDSITAGQAKDITFTFDAAYLNSGTYYANVNITCDDPDEPEVVIPVRLQVDSYLLAPQNLLISINGDTISISWDSVIGADSYKVFSSNELSGTYIEETGGVFIYPGDRVMWNKYYITIPEKLFFYVKAYSGSKLERIIK